MKYTEGRIKNHNIEIGKFKVYFTDINEKLGNIEQFSNEIEEIKQRVSFRES